MQLESGAMLAGRYTVVGLVRAGGMGAVYRATDSHLDNRLVALKQLLEPSPATDADLDVFRRRFEEEATVLTSLSHPGVPHVYDHFSEGDSHFIVMEFIAGTALDSLLEEYLRLTNGPMPVSEALDHGIQVAEILVYLHGRQPPILHRDMEPGNIIVGADKRVVLVDFGLARGTAGLTHTATMVGTLGFAAYEQVIGKPEVRSDLYSLGATLYHLVTGKLPPAFEIPTLIDTAPNLPPACAAAIDAATRAELNARVPTAVAMLALLQQAPLPGAASLKPEEAPLPAPRRIPPMAWAGLVAAVAVTAVLLWRPHATAPPPSPAIVVPAGGTLYVQSDPPDADVSIDAHPRGKTPLVLKDLSPQLYELHVSKPGFEATTTTALVEANRVSNCTVHLEKKVSVAVATASPPVTPRPVVRTPSPSSTPAPTPTVHATVVMLPPPPPQQDLVSPGGGVGKYRIHDEFDDVTLLQTTRATDDGQERKVYRIPDMGIAITGPQHRILYIRCTAGRTAGGTEIGSSRDHVLQEFGTSGVDGTASGEHVLEYRERGIAFVLTDRTVAAFILFEAGRTIRGFHPDP